jgi:hypothetical protein
MLETAWGYEGGFFGVCVSQDIIDNNKLKIY